MDKWQRKQLELSYRILDKLEPNAGWDRAVRILSEGVEAEYESLVDGYDYPITKLQTEQVGRLLHMFESLRDSVAHHPAASDQLKHRITFIGFDHNRPEELHLAGAAQYMFDEGRWESLKPDHGLNSHSPTLGRYREMLDRFEVHDRSGRDYRHNPLTLEELEQIAAA